MKKLAALLSYVASNLSVGGAQHLSARRTNLLPAGTALLSRPASQLAEASEAAPEAEHLVLHEPVEQHYIIRAGAVGFSFDSIFGPYLRGATRCEIEDSYMRSPYQIGNLVRFCETLVRAGSVRHIRLVTGNGGAENWGEIYPKLVELRQSLISRGVQLEVEINVNLHDRQVRLDNGWVVKVGRGLDIFQKPDGWYALGAFDLVHRKCKETHVDVYREPLIGNHMLEKRCPATLAQRHEEIELVRQAVT